ncbi:MAG: cell division protein FtsQ [Planctomycetaceae bacterium]|jgi:hypothetical protein|nr:cell division protein FtsQ [Phycisphaerales bacterium]MCE2652060.1 cell division protein FtsQ [Planctomycetaceae bacterium]
MPRAARDKTQQLKAHFRSATLAITLVLLAGAAIGVVYSREALRHQVGRLKEAPVSVDINWPVIGPPSRPGEAPQTWMSPSIRGKIELAALNALNGDPTDGASLKAAADALMATGWFSAIDAVRRGPEGVVQIRGQWRAPVAAVRYLGRDHLVSAEGDLLPLDYSPGGSLLKIILNPSMAVPGQPGEPWLGGDVQAGLALLGYLQRTPFYSQVKGIDVAEYQGRKRLVIVTDTDNRVIWGVSPTEWTAAEPTPEEKLRRLMQLYQSREHGRRIDANMPVVDVSNPRGVMFDRTALAALQAELSAELPPDSNDPSRVFGPQQGGSDQRKARPSRSTVSREGAKRQSNPPR